MKQHVDACTEGQWQENWTPFQGFDPPNLAPNSLQLVTSLAIEIPLKNITKREKHRTNSLVIFL